MAIETGGPAFPFVETGNCSVRTGMTLRDYFAAKAMAALIAEPCWGEGAVAMFSSLGGDSKDVAGKFAHAAHKLADAMIKARSE